MIGKTISHYRIIEKLGEGGMGVVYKAQDTKLDRIVALKFLPKPLLCDEEAKTRFVHEAKAASALNHANITTIHEIDEVEGECFISMEYIEGKSLKGLLEEKPLSLREVSGIAIQIGEGLNAAHKKDITHRDIKSDNIMVTKEGDVKIMDFGLAKLKGVTKLTKTGTTLGTTQYMSPEQAQGKEVDHRSDIFSFGVVLYEMITGQLPFKGEYEQAVIYSILNEEPEPVSKIRPEVSIELESIVKKALQKKSERRYLNTGALLADLRKVQAGAQVPPLLSKRKQRTRRLALGIASLLLLVGVVLMWPVIKQWLGLTEVKAKSLAVLSFENLGTEADGYLASGLAEDLAIKLRKLAGFRVASSEDIRRLSKEELLPKQIASRLKVQYALGGSLLKAGEWIRVNAEVIEQASGEVIWSEQFRRKFTNIHEFHDELSRKIAKTLEVQLSPAEQLALKEKPTKSPEAYDHYLKGRHYYYNVTFRDNELAEKEFQIALQLDPDYPLAVAGLADVYLQRYGEAFDYDEYWLDSADVLVSQALELDKDLAEAYEARAGVLFEKENYLGALEAAEMANNLRPDLDGPYLQLGGIYQQRGELSKALELFEQAIAIRPSVGAWCGKGNIFGTRLRFDSAEAAYRAAIELNPEQDRPYNALGWDYLENQGKIEEAETMFRRAIEVRPDRANSYLALVWIKGPEVEELVRDYVEKYPYNWEAYDALYQYLAWVKGDYPAALAVLEQAIANNPNRVWPYLLAATSRTYGMGKTVGVDKAVEEIERALELRPNSSRVLQAAGRVYASLDSLDRAMDFYRQALEVNPGSAGILRSMAALLLKQRRYDSAALVAREVINQTPGLTSSYGVLSKALAHLQRTDEYLDVLKNAADNYGQDDPGFFEFLGNEQCLSGRFEDAVVTYQRRLDIKRDPDPLMGLGMVQWLSGNPENALKTFYDATTSEYWTSQWRYVLRIISLLKYMGRFDEIEQHLDSLHKENVESWDGFATDYYRSMRRFDDALAVHDEILKSKEKRSWEDWDMLSVARLYRQMGKLAKAREILKDDDESWPVSVIVGVNIERAILTAIEGDLNIALNLAREAFEDSPADYFYDIRAAFFATMQYATGQTEEALTTLKKVKSLRIDNLLPALYLRAQLETISGSKNAEYYVEKVQLFAARVARNVHPLIDLGKAHCLCALASARLGDLKRARDDIEYAHRLEPERADIAYYSACAYSLIGDTTLAFQWLETAVERGHQELWWARVDPDLDPLRTLPRFQEIMNDWDTRLRKLFD